MGPCCGSQWFRLTVVIQRQSERGHDMRAAALLGLSLVVPHGCHCVGGNAAGRSLKWRAKCTKGAYS